MIIENMTAKEALEWVRNIVSELCEETENDAPLRTAAHDFPSTDEGAFAIGRITEAREIRVAVQKSIQLMLGD